MKSNHSKPRLMVAASESDADMLYATHFFEPDAFIFLEQNGKRTLVLSDLEIDRGRKQAEADEILPYSEFEKEVQGKSAKAPAYEKVLAHFLAKKKVKSALVPAKFPLGFARELEANKIRVEPAGELYWPDRETKTEAELRLLRKALEITEAGMARGMEVLKKSKPGKGGKLEWSGKVLTSEILRAEIDSAVLRAGGLPANTIVAGGDQACDPHERGHGPLKANSLIILDIFPRSAASGYYGDLTRTVVRGRASDAQRRLWDTVNQGQALALKKMKPGVDGLKLHQEVKEFFTDQGYPTEVRDGKQTGFFHGTGHGLGLEIHEFPRFQKTVFKAGQVLTVEPGLYYPGLGGVRTEDVVALTKRGIRMLSRFENRLEL
jgi:Xaa-Pro aminopeptidase